ncbi:MAG: hypothetical protein ACTSWY_05780 [Promethearchaeota archaeon]
MNREKEIEKNFKKGKNRLVSIDFLRGIAIWAMTLFHAFEHVIEIGPVNLNNADDFPIFLILGMTFGVFSYWRSFFLLISAVVHMYSMDRSVKKGNSRSGVLKKQLFLGFLIYLIGLLRESVFSSGGFLGMSYENRSWSPAFLKNIFVFETLNMIGVGIIFSSIVHFILTRNNGVHKIKRNAIIFGILAAFFIFLRPIIDYTVDMVFGCDFITIQRDVTGFGDGLLRLFWVMLAGFPEPIFPFLGTTFIGCLVGILLNQDNPPKKMIRYGYLSGFLIVILGIGIFIITDVSFSFLVEIFPLYFYLFHLGIQVIILSLALRVIEFNPKIKMESYRDNVLKRTQFIRRWGMLSLTVYFFQILDVLSREILYQVTCIPFQETNNVDISGTILIVVVIMFLWEVTIRLWEKIKFKGSLEWLVLQFSSVIGMKADKEDPLSIQGILYDMEFITFT